MPKLFKKTIEDFVCEKCGTDVRGTGFTNHCPKCLWGKHVDINPGDRLATCGGMMKPHGLHKKGDEYVLNFVCEKCGFERKNKLSKEDDFDVALRL